MNGVPCSSIKMLPGFRSRWIKPFSCSTSRPAATCLKIAMTWWRARAPQRSRRSPSARVRLDPPPATEPSLERAAADEALGGPGQPLVVAGRAHGDHVGVVDPLSDLRFSLEALQEDLVDGHFLLDRLECDRLAVGPDRLEDAAHASLAEFGLDRVAADRVAHHRFCHGARLTSTTRCRRPKSPVRL